MHHGMNNGQWTLFFDDVFNKYLILRIQYQKLCAKIVTNELLGNSVFEMEHNKKYMSTYSSHSPHKLDNMSVEQAIKTNSVFILRWKVSDIWRSESAQVYSLTVDSDWIPFQFVHPEPCLACVYRFLVV
jgi:hypothetical protein